jgi:hypothetical protein
MQIKHFGSVCIQIYCPILTGQEGCNSLGEKESFILDAKYSEQTDL